MRRSLVARLDRQKCYADFLRTQGWDRPTVDAQVLTPLNEASLMATPADQTSIMCYQLPGSITIDGRPIVGGLDINATDATFAARIYPKSRSAEAMTEATEAAAPETRDDADDWGEENDPKTNCDLGAE